MVCDATAVAICLATAADAEPELVLLVAVPLADAMQLLAAAANQAKFNEPLKIKKSGR